MTTRRIGKTVYCDLEDRWCYLGKWKLPFLAIDEKINEEFLIFADEAVFMLDGIEHSGTVGEWRIA